MAHLDHIVKMYYWKSIRLVTRLLLSFVSWELRLKRPVWHEMNQPASDPLANRFAVVYDQYSLTVFAVVDARFVM